MVCTTRSLPPFRVACMSIANSQPVFTIGHSNLEIGKFVALLKQHGIQAIADVRSSPYSQYNPQFNRELLQRALQEKSIAYVFLGRELGARRSERECYLEGRADYELISQTSAFKQGIERLIQGAARMRIALMCAEKDPIDCHRCLLVSPHLQRRGLQVCTPYRTVRWKTTPKQNNVFCNYLRLKKKSFSDHRTKSLPRLTRNKVKKSPTTKKT